MEADGLFHKDPRWLGADTALSVPLDEGRTLWLFGDTFAAFEDLFTKQGERSLYWPRFVAVRVGK